ncbi:Protein CBG26079 [Caenorhabditis briggsae]|jgi:methyl-accepting chemotaxis protein
MTFS